MADEYVLKSSVLNAIHNGDIDMGMVTTKEYRLLKDLSERIDRRIQRVPVADVRPVVRGKWGERRFSETVYGAECSVCHTTWDAPTNFCPNCGAKNDEEE